MRQFKIVYRPDALSFRLRLLMRKVDPGEGFWTEEEIAEEQRMYSRDEANETLEKLFQARKLMAKRKTVLSATALHVQIVVMLIKPQDTEKHHSLSRSTPWNLKNKRFREAHGLLVATLDENDFRENVARLARCSSVWKSRGSRLSRLFSVQRWNYSRTLYFALTLL